MFCKVCKDAGKSEQEYTNHSVRNNQGKVLCPTLLNQSCKYCKNTGHTVKYCEVLKLKEKNERREEYFNKQKPKKTNDNKYANNNTFASAFDDDSDTELESELESDLETEFDTELGTHLETQFEVNFDLNEKLPIATNYIRSYASVLVDDSVPQVKNFKTKEKDTNTNTNTNTNMSNFIQNVKDENNFKSKFWGDDYDSDEE